MSNYSESAAASPGLLSPSTYQQHQLELESATSCSSRADPLANAGGPKPFKTEYKSQFTPFDQYVYNELTDTFVKPQSLVLSGESKSSRSNQDLAGAVLLSPSSNESTLRNDTSSNGRNSAQSEPWYKEVVRRNEKANEYRFKSEVGHNSPLLISHMRPISPQCASPLSDASATPLDPNAALPQDGLELQHKFTANDYKRDHLIAHMANNNNFNLPKDTNPTTQARVTNATPTGRRTVAPGPNPPPGRSIMRSTVQSRARSQSSRRPTTANAASANNKPIVSKPTGQTPASRSTHTSPKKALTPLTSTKTPPAARSTSASLSARTNGVRPPPTTTSATRKPAAKQPTTNGVSRYTTGGTTSSPSMRAPLSKPATRTTTSATKLNSPAISKTKAPAPTSAPRSVTSGSSTPKSSAETPPVDKSEQIDKIHYLLQEKLPEEPAPILSSEKPQSTEVQAPAQHTEVEAPSQSLEVQAPSSHSELHSPSPLPELQSPSPPPEVQSPSPPSEVDSPSSPSEAQSPSPPLEVGSSSPPSEMHSPSSPKNAQAPPPLEALAPSQPPDVQASSKVSELQASPQPSEVQASSEPLAVQVSPQTYEVLAPSKPSESDASSQPSRVTALLEPLEVHASEEQTFSQTHQVLASSLTKEVLTSFQTAPILSNSDLFDDQIKLDNVQDSDVATDDEVARVTETTDLANLNLSRHEYEQTLKEEEASPFTDSPLMDTVIEPLGGEKNVSKTFGSTNNNSRSESIDLSTNLAAEIKENLDSSSSELEPSETVVSTQAKEHDVKLDDDIQHSVVPRTPDPGSESDSDTVSSIDSQLQLGKNANHRDLLSSESETESQNYKRKQSSTDDDDDDDDADVEGSRMRDLKEPNFLVTPVSTGPRTFDVFKTEPTVDDQDLPTANDVESNINQDDPIRETLVKTEVNPTMTGCLMDLMQTEKHLDLLEQGSTEKPLSSELLDGSEITGISDLEVRMKDGQEMKETEQESEVSLIESEPFSLMQTASQIAEATGLLPEHTDDIIDTQKVSRDDSPRKNRPDPSITGCLLDLLLSDEQQMDYLDQKARDYVRPSSNSRSALGFGEAESVLKDKKETSANLSVEEQVGGVLEKLDESNNNSHDDTLNDNLVSVSDDPLNDSTATRYSDSAALTEDNDS